MEVENVVQAIKEEEPLEIVDYHLFEESGVVEEEGSEESEEIVKCESCSEVYKSLEELNQHCLDKHSSQTKKCRTCSKVFANKTLLDSHLIKHHKCFQCEICSKIYSTKDSFRCHMKKRHPLKCEHCEETFESKKRLIQHVSEKHAIQESNPNTVQCEKCSKFYASKDSLSVHMRTTHNLKCKQCGEMFTSKELLNEHYSESHSPQERKCHVCNEILPDQTMLESHLDSLHKNLQCKECSVFTTNKNSLKCHMFRHHRMKCSYCPRAFQSRRKFDKHLIKDHSDMSIQDPVEEGESVSEKKHFEKPKVKCFVCQAVFENKTLLESHTTAMHKNFQCKICAKLYASEDSLRGHMRKEHRFKCEHCEDTFGIGKHLIQHCSEKHQSQVRKCHICAESLVNQVIFEKHMESEHEFVKCKECGTFVTNKNALRSHMSQYHRLSCEHCPKVFQMKRKYDKHLIEEHSAENSQLAKKPRQDLNQSVNSDDSAKNSHSKNSDNNDLIAEDQSEKCKECGTFVTNKNALRSHMFQYHRFSCEHCPKVFQVKRKYDKHLIEDHSAENSQLAKKPKQDLNKSVNSDYTSKDEHSKNLQNDDLIADDHSEKSESDDIANDSAGIEKYNCDQCSSSFETLNELEYHKKEHTPRLQTTKCDICKESFDDQVILDDHLFTQHKCFQCNICAKLYSSKDSLRRHISRGHPLKCEHCESTFESKRRLIQHNLQEHGIRDQNPNSVQCEICLTSYASKVYLATHMRIKHAEKGEDSSIITVEVDNIKSDLLETTNELEASKKEPEPKGRTTKCDICNENFESEVILDDHLLKLHKCFQCNICSKLYSSKDSLRCHLKRGHPLKCEHCEETFESKKRLKDHCLEKHGIEEKNPETVQCKVCLKSYTGRESLASHMRANHNWKCDLCGQVVTSKRKLDQHYIDIHPAEKRKCSICDEVLVDQAQLESHMDTQHKPVQCKECNIFAQNRNSLKCHMFRYHRLKCDHCSKAFQSKRKLDSHLITEHNVELNHSQGIESESDTNDVSSEETVEKCHNCDEAFENRTLLDNHLKTHHKYFKCEICSKLYATKDSLRDHLTKYHPLKCEHCEETFVSKKRLMQHCSEKHGIEEKNPNSVQCQVCSKWYASRESLGAHMRTTHSLRCEYCDKMCTTKKRLGQHYAEEHPNQERKCHLCDEILKNQAVLQSHMDSEHKSAQCKVCGIFNVSKDALKSHMYRNHRIQCDHCPKTLHSKKKYDQHLKAEHSIEIFSCDHCDSTFSSTVTLKKHTAENHDPNLEGAAEIDEDNSEDDDMIVDSIEIEKYTCDQCCESFDAFHELEYHKKKHIARVDHWDENSTRTEVFKGELYQCNICNKRFESIDDLEKHSKNHIKKELDC